jgi:predicted RNase H-like HicB family nuclease
MLDTALHAEPGIPPDYFVLVRGRHVSCDAVYVTHVVHAPYVVEQDEDGVWCASALLRPGVGAFGDGATPEEAVTDLRTALETLVEVPTLRQA